VRRTLRDAQSKDMVWKETDSAQTLIYKPSHKREVFTVRFVIFGLRPLGFVMYFMTDRT